MAHIRLLLSIDSLGSEGGTERQFVELVRRLDRAKFEVHVACLEDSPALRALADIATTTVYPVGNLFTPNGLGRVLDLRRYMIDQRIDVAHSFMINASLATVAATRWTKVRKVVTSRRNMGYWHTPRYLKMLRWMNQRTTAIVANSNAVRKKAIEAEGADPDKVHVIYNGVDMAAFTPGKSGMVVGTVANYRPVKDLPLFLEMASRLPDATFLLVGSGPQIDELRDLAAQLGIAGRVTFTNGTGNVADHLRLMSVFCLTSASEGFSNAILEAMATGLPVIATDTGGNAEAVEDGVTGYLVHGREPDVFATRVLSLLWDPNKRSAMGSAALGVCREKFSMEAMVGAHEALYS